MALIKPTLTEPDRLALTDIAWFLKGYLLGNPADSDLGEDHLVVMKKVIEIARHDVYETKQKEEKSEIP